MLRAGEIDYGVDIAPHSSAAEALLTALAAVFDRILTAEEHIAVTAARLNRIRQA